MLTVSLFLALSATLTPLELPPAPQETKVKAKAKPRLVQAAKSAPKASPAKAPKSEVDRIVDAMQKTYESTQDFSASFTQRYTNTLFRRTTESKGNVEFKKPGLMRWDYKSPSTKSFVVDGKRLWVYQQEDKTALVDHCFKQDGLTASVAFLWGSGDIREQFDVKPFGGVFGDKDDDHLELTPKSKNGVFAKLILVLDPKTHRVKQSVVVDAQGNVNQFMYTTIKFNAGLTAKTFAFTPPKGVHVSRVPGSCDPAKTK